MIDTCTCMHFNKKINYENGEAYTSDHDTIRIVEIVNVEQLILVQSMYVLVLVLLHVVLLSVYHCLNFLLLFK